MPAPYTSGSPLTAHERSERAQSFGGMASHYERYRPGPPAAAVDWILPTRVDRVVDLGAGTGALTRLLVDRAGEVVAVEPDDRMRAVLTEEVPAAQAVAGRGESMPVPDASVDAVVASTSWHWMVPVPTLHEVGRVLVPGGILGTLWSGPDPEGAFVVQARALLAGRAGDRTQDRAAGASELAEMMLGEAQRTYAALEIPSGTPFDPPDHEVFTWDVSLDADDLIGLLGTFSWIITLPEQTRRRVVGEARRLLSELLGVEGDVTVDVGFRCDAYRSRRHA